MSAAFPDLAVPKSILDTDLYKVSQLFSPMNRILIATEPFLVDHATSRVAPFPHNSGIISLHKSRPDNTLLPTMYRTFPLGCLSSVPPTLIRPLQR
jgi:hypothetical protein